ncbi:MAG: hypothetical protein JWO52_4576 [Gammaproteobacteria bacterium]|nr:hypothetical protein [Gammaproteobacteria bacterium]
MTFDQWGALAFGVVIGWITYRTLRRREGTSALSDIATVIGAVGGAAVLTIFKAPGLFAAYSMGLAAGFFLYFLISLALPGSNPAKNWMGD